VANHNFHGTGSGWYENRLPAPEGLKVKLCDDKRLQEKAVKMEIRPADLKNGAEARGNRVLYIVVVRFGARFNNTAICLTLNSPHFFTITLCNIK
jgi:hypothetical protein